MPNQYTNKGLPEKRKLFVLEYLKDHNGSAAAIRAGYAKSNAADTAWRILNDPRVQKQITALNSVTASNMGITRSKVMKRLADIAFFDVRKIYKNGHLVPVDKLDESSAAAIAGIESESILEGLGYLTKVKIRDTRAAFDSLTKMLGWNAPEKLDHTTDDESLNDLGIDKLNDNEKLMYLRLKQKMVSDASTDESS